MGVFVGSGVFVGVAVGMLVSVGSGVAVTGLGVAVTTMTTGLGVGVVPQAANRSIPINTTPMVIADVTNLGNDLPFINFFMP